MTAIDDGAALARPTPDLIQLAIEKGMDADSLGKLLDLIERREKFNAEAAYSRAMKDAQAAMPIIVQDATNTQTGSKYATTATIKKQCRPVYEMHGFSLSFAEDDSPLPGFVRTICDVMHSGGHTKRYHLDLPRDGIGPKGNPIGGMNAVQGSVSSGSYAVRILTTRIFDITIADSDRDGNSMADMLYINDAQRLEIDQLLTQNRLDPKRLLAWIQAGVPEEERSLDTITIRQFTNIVNTYRQRKGGAS